MRNDLKGRDNICTCSFCETQIERNTGMKLFRVKWTFLFYFILVLVSAFVVTLFIKQMDFEYSQNFDKKYKQDMIRIELNRVEMKKQIDLLDYQIDVLLIMLRDQSQPKPTP